MHEKNAPAAFFVTGHYMQSNPEIIQRMHDEGHLVCNHTLNHKDLSSTTEISTYQQELDGLCELYLEITGDQMPRFMRPPEGKYSESMLQIVQEMGYTPVFWSFAYKDWLNDAQPDEASAKKTILSRTHPGEVALLHSTSATNAAILGEVIDAWRAQGYEIHSIQELALTQ